MVFYIKSYFSESIGILIEGWYILWQCKDLSRDFYVYRIHHIRMASFTKSHLGCAYNWIYLYTRIMAALKV